MENRGSTSATPNVAHIWTFLVEGHPIIFEVPQHPPLCHREGGRTLWKFVGSETAAEGIANLLRDAQMEVSFHKEEVTPEMVAAPRPNIDEYEFRTHMCPFCYFFDPGEVATMCGWESWPDERLDVAYKVEKAQGDINECPLHKGDN